MCLPASRVSESQGLLIFLIKSCWHCGALAVQFQGDGHIKPCRDFGGRKGLLHRCDAAALPEVPIPYWFDLDILQDTAAGAEPPDSVPNTELGA